MYIQFVDAEEGLQAQIANLIGKAGDRGNFLKGC